MIGTIIDGKYRLDSRLQTGLSGEVYRATQLNLQRTVVVKFIGSGEDAKPDRVDRFRREALAVARLRHPNIVTVYDFGTAPGLGVYLVMESLEGETLAGRIADSGPLDPTDAAHAIRQVCLAVAAAHMAGVLHRDIRPSKILLEGHEAPRVKVLDFGVSKMFEQDALATPTTSEGELQTIPLYLAPELCDGVNPTVASEIYSIGCVLFEALTGRPPFPGPHVAAILRGHMELEPPALSTLVEGAPPLLEELLKMALAKDPAKRFQDALALAEALSAAVPSSELPPTIPIEPLARMRSGNLPQEMASFVGREDEIIEIRELMEAARLLTLLGPGGIGKTRLAVEVARGARKDFPDGTWIVDLSAITDGGQVENAVADVLGVREGQGRPLLHSLADAVRRKRQLLILDNCEHVLEGCGHVAPALLRASADLRIIATSRAPLDLPGEAVWTIPALSVPTLDESLDDLSNIESVSLFVERVRLNRPNFTLSDQNMKTVAALCRTLEGIPLAIELAAARARVLSVEQILSKMDDRFHLLARGGRSAQMRQQTLRATIDWSYDFLSEPERMLLRRLSVFAGGCGVSAAEDVCAGHPIESWAVLDLISQLVDKSLVMADSQGREARYRMLEMIRQYSAERLRESDEARTYLARHRAWVLSLAESAEEEGYDGGNDAWVSRLRAEHDNVRAALRWSLGGGGDGDAGLRLAAALGLFWFHQGLWTEGLRWLESALAAARSSPPALRAKAVQWAGSIAESQGDVRKARALLEECLVLKREVGNPREIAQALNMLANIARDLGDFDHAVALLGEALEISRGLEDEYGAATSVTGLGLVAAARGEYLQAKEHFEDALSVFREVGEPRSEAVLLHNLGEVAGRLGDDDRARRLLEESLSLARADGDRRVEAFTVHALGGVATRSGDASHAIGLFREALSIHLRLDNKRGVAHVLEGLACAYSDLEPDRALRLAGAASALRDVINATLPPAERGELESFLSRARRRVGGDTAIVAFGSGRSMAVEDAIELARS